MTRIYKTLSRPAEYSYEEKRSRFLARLWSVRCKEEGFEHFAQIKAQYSDARHHCWAYLIGDPEQALSAGFNDDGEPGGTAGKPMLHVLTQRQAGDVFAVVVRYFGGIKLGAGGLARAYGAAVSGALDNADWVDVVPHQSLTIITDFATEERIRHLLGQRGIVDLQVEYRQQVYLSCQCPEHLLADIRDGVQQQSAGQASFFLPEHEKQDQR